MFRHLASRAVRSASRVVRSAAPAARTTRTMGTSTSGATTWAEAMQAHQKGIFLALSGVGLGLALTEMFPRASTEAKLWEVESNEVRQRPDLPVYTLKDLRAHTSDETGYWVAFKGAVYDVTSFVDAHPGGAGRIKMAAGNDLMPFWDVYRLHLRGHIVPLLEEKYRIGTLNAHDAREAANFVFSDPYEYDPPRIPENTPCTHKPYCGEARLDLLTESYFTPNELFYTRNHNTVPDVDAEDYELIIEGNGVNRTVFTLEDLKTKFEQIEIVTAIQCAGNRGEDYHGLGKGPSGATFLAPHWSAGAISNCKWTGVRIRDLLKVAGLDVDAVHNGELYLEDGQHLKMWAYDTDETGEEYGASTYMDKIVDPNGDCIIAFKMNDRDIPRDHGFPCRAIIPGHAGARQPKWVHRLEIVSAPYCVLQCLNLPQSMTFEEDLSSWPPKRADADYRANAVVQEMPVQSLICNPPQNAIIGAKGLENLTIKGVAWSGGGSAIKRVDVSMDNGENFTDSELYKPVVQRRKGNWGWTQFFHTFELSDDIKSRLEKGEKVNLMLTSKAVDGQFNVQPEHPNAFVNPRGTAVNHWYRVSVTLDPSLPNDYMVNPQAEASKRGQYANVPSGGAFRIPFREGGWQNGNNADNETTFDWHKYATPENTKNEPGIEASIDWDFYRSIKAPNFYDKAKKVNSGNPEECTPCQKKAMAAEAKRKAAMQS
eukprot:m.166073 g.166073  ORF g.166073 m.166073 type:complete len:711 (-) comp14440_c0_seq1:1600-3732(-)